MTAWKKWLGFTLLVLVFSSGESRGQDMEATATWVAQNCASVQEAVLAADRLDVVQPERPSVVIRLGGEFTLDTQISLFFEGDHLTAEIVRAKGASICQQLEKIHRSRSKLDTATAASLVQVQRTSVCEKENPKLLTHYEQLKHIKVDLWPNDGLYAPSRGVILWIRGFDGEVRVAYAEPDPSTDSVSYTSQPTSPRPEISAWIQGLLKELDLKM